MLVEELLEKLALNQYVILRKDNKFLVKFKVLDYFCYGSFTQYLKCEIKTLCAEKDYIQIFI